MFVLRDDEETANSGEFLIKLDRRYVAVTDIIVVIWLQMKIIIMSRKVNAITNPKVDMTAQKSQRSIVIILGTLLVDARRGMTNNSNLFRCIFLFVLIIRVHQRYVTPTTFQDRTVKRRGMLGRCRLNSNFGFDRLVW